MKNEFITIGALTIMLIKSKHGLFEVKIDTKNIAEVSQHAWSIEGYPKNIYVSHRSRKIRNLKLHRFIKDCPDGMVVDHRNRDRMDYREDNLIICTQAINRENMPINNPNNKSSGVKNVVWVEQHKKWKVIIESNKTRHFIGYFTDIEKAKAAANEARIKYHNYDNILQMVRK